MYTALEDIKIDKIDFQWIKSTTKLSHLKRAIRVIQLDGDYYHELKQACYQRIQQIDPSQKRIKVSNSISNQTKNLIQNQLLQWQTSLEKQNQNSQKQINKNNDLQDIQSYFSNQQKQANNERNKKMAQSQRVKGNEAIKSKDFQEAINYYTSSLKFNPLMHQSFCNRALAYLKTKQYQKCIDDCQSTLKIDKNSTKAYHRKAKALIALNKKTQGYRNLQQAQKIQPDNNQLTKQLKQLREQMSPEEIKQLDSHLIPKSQFRKITIEQDSQEDD